MQLVLNGNNLDILKDYPDNHFDAVVTDPPYGLGKEPDAVEVMQSWVSCGYHQVKGSGFMGKEWDAFVPQPNFWKEVYRVLKHGGHVLAFYGTRTYDWGVMAMRFAGFEVRDCIQWIYGSGFPKSHNIGKNVEKINVGGIKNLKPIGTKKGIKVETGTQGFSYNKEYVSGKSMGGKQISGDIPVYEINNEWEGWGSALKPASEPIVLARKPLEKGLSIAENVLKWGTGGINIDGCRVGYEGATKRSHQSEYPKKENGTEDRSGHWERVGHYIEELNKGRFPANIILTHHPECECKGVKEIKNNGIAIRKSGGNTFGGNNKKPPLPNLGYGDENGQETIEDWNCHPDCPIKIMDEQSISMGMHSAGVERQNSNNPDLDTNKGRFPANLIMTHHPECECKGLKKVKGVTGGKNDIIVESKYGQVSDIPQKPFDYADENGEETVEDWNCHPDCPIKIMDEQSISMGMHSAGVERKKDVKSEYDNSSFHAPKTRQMNRFGDVGGASRFFYCAKASKSERNKGLEGFEKKIGSTNHNSSGRDIGGKQFCKLCNKRQGACKCEFPIFTNSNPNTRVNFHPTVKPIKLMQYLVRLITPPNGKVLDPFAGSGTTGIACRLEGFNFVGIEQDPEYCKIAEARIKNFIQSDEDEVHENSSDISTNNKDENSNLGVYKQLSLF